MLPATPPIHRLGLSATLLLGALTTPTAAQVDTIVVSGYAHVSRLDPHAAPDEDPSIDDRPITGLASFEQVRILWDDEPEAAGGLFLIAQANDGSAQRYALDAGTGQATDACELNLGFDFQGEPLRGVVMREYETVTGGGIGILGTGYGTSLLTTESGRNYNPLWCPDAFVASPAPEDFLVDPILGSASLRPDRHYILTGPNTDLQLLEYDVPPSTLAGTPDWSLLRSIPLSFLAYGSGYHFGWHVYGMTVGADERVYMLVQDVISDLGHGNSQAILVRSNETLGSLGGGASLTFSQVGMPIGSDPSIPQNPDPFLYLLPPVAMAFEGSGSPIVQTFLVDDALVGTCDAITLSASWDGGVSEGVVSWDTGSGSQQVAISSGGSVQVTPPAPEPGESSKTTSFTLTLTNLAGAEHDISLDVTVERTTIVAHPIDATTCSGSSASFSTEVAGASTSHTFQLQRQSGGSWSNVGTALTTMDADASLSTGAVTSGGTYRVLVQDACSQFVYSEEASLTVNAAPTVTSAPPTSLLLCEDATISLQYGAASTPAASWALRRTTLDAALQPVVTVVASGTGFSGPTITYADTVTTAHEGDYDLTLTSSCGTTGSATTAVTVIAHPAIAVGGQPQDSAVSQGSPFQLTVTTEPGGPFGYQWFQDGVALPGATGATYTDLSADPADAGDYHVEISGLAVCGHLTVSDPAQVQVVGPPAMLSAAEGASDSGVLLSWTAVPGAQSYRVLRTVYPVGAPDVPVSDWIAAESFVDADDLGTPDLELMPGQSYRYAVQASPFAPGSGKHPAQPLSSMVDEGWQALSPPAGTVAYAAGDDYSVAVDWLPVVGATHYQVRRTQVPFVEPSEPVHVGWLVDDGSPTQQFLDYATVPNTTYFYEVVAAVDEQGDRPSVASLLDDGSRSCSAGDAFASPCSPEGLTVDEGPVMLLLIDRSLAMQEVRPSTGNTRCEDALTLAAADLQNFFSHCPDGKAAVWTFSDTCVSNLTGGFTSREQAELVLGLLTPDGCAGGAPLADALAQSAQVMFGCSPLLNPDPSACVPFPDEQPTPALQRLLVVHSAGENDASAGPYGGLPDPLSGDCQSGFTPPGNWGTVVCSVLSGFSTLLVHEWNSLADVIGPSASTLGQLALSTGGLHESVIDEAPLPPGFFLDCNGNGIDDQLEISAGVAADCNANGIPDACETGIDCNTNGVPDSCEIAQGRVADLDGDGQPDDCQGFAVSAPQVAVGGTLVDLHVLGAQPSSLVALIAGFQAGLLPMPGCPGLTIGIEDFAAYGPPLLWLLPTTAEGHVQLTLLTPPVLSGFEVLLQGLSPAPTCDTTEVTSVRFL